jgi:hypothetical protein
MMIVLILTPLAAQTSLTAAQGCELVELRPGYPGYRGFVTGVDGIGDHECLEDLEDEDAGFSKRREDRENRQAAENLDLDGSPDEWTWENWLAIESERGLTPTCYSCAFAEADSRPEPRRTGVESGDPRLRCGAFGEATYAAGWLRQNGYAMISGVADWGDYELRATAWLSSRKSHLNAEELMEIYDLLLEETIKPAGEANSPDARAMWDRLVEQGSYFEIADDLWTEDQVFLFYVGLFGLGRFTGQRNLEILYNLTQQAEFNWYTEGIDTMTFSEYLQEIGAADWF